MTVKSLQILFQRVELIVFVYEKGSDESPLMPSLPSHRWLCADAFPPMALR